MVQASIESPMSGQAESSTAAMILRNDDPLTQALRNGAALDMDDIARLNRAVSPVQDTLSSLGSTSTAVFSAKDESTVTKPTSTGTPYPYPAYKGKGKAKAPSTSSLSVAYGSGSEADAQCHTTRRDALLAMGDWAAGDLVPAEPLKGAARAKTRYFHVRQQKHKKPLVKIIQPTGPTKAVPDRCSDAIAAVIPSGDGSEQKYLRRRVTMHDEDRIRLAEEGQIDPAPIQSLSYKSLSPIRAYMLVGITIMMISTIALSVWGAHYTGKARMACTKGIVFGSTVLTAFFTVLAMITARRALQEALLAGLLEIIIGFALLGELDDFM